MINKEKQKERICPFHKKWIEIPKDCRICALGISDIHRKLTYQCAIKSAALSLQNIHEEFKELNHILKEAGIGIYSLKKAVSSSE